MSEEKLFLWDIDGTLISVGGAGERALLGAIRDTFGFEGDLSVISYSGRTDRWITKALHEAYDLELTEGSQQAFLDAYLRHLEIEMKATRMVVLDGVIETLEIIKNNPNFHQGLLTGNLQKGSEIKLKHFNIWHYFPFGAFSNLSVNRNDLAKHALKVSQEATGIQFDPSDVYVIGDTSHDIECGKIIGARTVAIATGKIRKEELSTYKPDFLFDQIGDASHFLDTLL